MKPSSCLVRLSCVALFAISLSGCSGHGGGGGGGGGSNDVIDLNFGPVLASGTYNVYFTDGTQQTVTFRVANVGYKASDQTVTATVVLPTGTTYVSYASTTAGWTCGVSGQTVTCTSSASIPGSGSSDFAITVKVASDASGNPMMSCSVSTADGSPATSSSSSAVGFIDPVPTLTSLSPNSVITGSAGFTLTLTGTNFVADSVVQWNGVSRTTTVVSGTQLTASILATDVQAPGTASVTVNNPRTSGAKSNAVTFTIGQPVPTLTSINPTSASVNSPAFTLELQGTNFTSASQVLWGTTSLTVTSSIGSGVGVQITAAVPASALTTAGTIQVTVVNPPPYGGTSNALPFTVNATNTVPSIYTLTPASAYVNSAAVTVAIWGANFVSASQAQWQWNCAGAISNLATTVTSVSAIQATIPVSDLTTVGYGCITVYNPPPGGGTSSYLGFAVNAVPQLKITTAVLPDGFVNKAYTPPQATLAATGGITPYTWSVINGSLPAGLQLSSGVISGTPTATGTSTFTVQVSDAETPAQTATQQFSITIDAAQTALTITTTSPLSGATLNNQYSTTITASGGTPPYNWYLGPTSGLPTGLTLTTDSPSATISGTPTVTGTYKFTLNVSDSATPMVIKSAPFFVTITGSSSFTCPSPVNLTLCGTYVFEISGFNSSNGPTGFGGTFVADNSGHIISGGEISNDSVNGSSSAPITGGYYSFSSFSGMGSLVLIRSDASATGLSFAIPSSTNPGGGPIIVSSSYQISSNGVEADGMLVGPITTPVPQIPAKTVLAVLLRGVNGSGQNAAILGDFQIGNNGCDGSTGSFNSQTGEPLVSNTGGTVVAGLSATGSCSAADANGMGTAQITLSGGSPFASNTLRFTYLIVAPSGTVQDVALLETDSIAANQPVFGGLGAVVPSVGSYNASVLGECPCLLMQAATTDGTSSGNEVESITRVTATPTSATSGTLAGIIDQNAGGTITNQGTWPYTAFTIDSNGVGTITGTNQKTIHFVIADRMVTLDESSHVNIGNMHIQKSYGIQHPGSTYFVGPYLEGGVNAAHTDGTLSPAGTATDGTMSGELVNSEDSNLLSPAGTYVGISSTTGRGTGTFHFTPTDNIPPVVIYTLNDNVFWVLDMQSPNPYVAQVTLQ